jgi:cell division protein FtsL
MSARTEKKQGDRSPLVRIRQMIIVIVGIVAFFSVPLILVWKQTYIRGSSVRLEAMADTLSMLDKKISVLRLKSERLSNIERIETFAKVSLGLDYPSSDRMVIVSMGGKDDRRSGRAGEKGGELLASVQSCFPKSAAPAGLPAKGGPQ